MRLLVDIAIVVLVALMAWRGWRNGLINGICGIIAIIIAVYGANLVAYTYSGEMVGVLEPFAAGYIEGVTSDILDYDPATSDSAEEDRFVPVFALTESQKEDPYYISTSVMRQLGIHPQSAEPLAQSVSELVRTNEDMPVITAITDVLCERLSFILVFALGFVIIAVVFSAIGNILDLSFGLPGLETLNKITGAILGAAHCVLVLIVIGALTRYLGMVLQGEMVEGSFLLPKLMENNFVSKFLGI